MIKIEFIYYILNEMMQKLKKMFDYMEAIPNNSVKKYECKKKIVFFYGVTLL